MNASLDTVIEWMGRASRNAKAQNRHDSALLWEDGLHHLVILRHQRDELLEALKFICTQKGFEPDEPYGKRALSAIAKARG